MHLFFSSLSFSVSLFRSSISFVMVFIFIPSWWSFEQVEFSVARVSLVSHGTRLHHVCAYFATSHYCDATIRGFVAIFYYWAFVLELFPCYHLRQRFTMEPEHPSLLLPAGHTFSGGGCSCWLGIWFVMDGYRCSWLMLMDDRMRFLVSCGWSGGYFAKNFGESKKMVL